MSNPKNKENQLVDSKPQPTTLVANQVADGDNPSATSFEAILGRMKLVTGAKSDTAFAKALGMYQGSVSSAKERQSIPPAWAVQIAEQYDVSLDWLMFGAGEMKRGGGMMFKTAKLPNSEMDPACGTDGFLQASMELRPEAFICNDNARRNVSIADMLTKTAKVLESDTVYREALYSNIEAFHHGVTMDQRVNRMEQQLSQVMTSFQAQLDQIHAENQQLRKDLEDSRSQSAVRDTG